MRLVCQCITIELPSSHNRIMIYQIVFLIFSVKVLRCHGNNVHLENNSLDRGIEGGYRGTEINLNRWFDRSLPLIKKYMVERGLEPMSLPEMNLPVPDIPGFKPKTVLNNGMLHGTSNVSRSGDIIQRVFQNSWQVDLQLNWRQLELNYDYSLTYRFYKRKGALTGSFSNLNVVAIGTVDLKARKVELRYLKIVDAGYLFYCIVDIPSKENITDFSVRLRGHLADYVANAAMKAMNVVFKKRMLREMEHEMNIVAQLKIKEVNDWLANQTSMPDLTDVLKEHLL